MTTRLRQRNTKPVPVAPAFDHTVSPRAPGESVIVAPRRLRAPKGESYHQIKLGVPAVLIHALQAHAENPAEWGGALLRLADFALHEVLLKEGQSLRSLPSEHAGLTGKPLAVTQRKKA